MWPRVRTYFSQQIRRSHSFAKKSKKQPETEFFFGKAAAVIASITSL